jgi:hypothetical protein
MALGGHTKDSGKELIDVFRSLYDVVRRRQQDCVIGIECTYTLRVAAIRRNRPEAVILAKLWNVERTD